LLTAAAVAALEPTAATLLRPCFVDGESAAVNFLLVECLTRRPSLRSVGHLDEAETARPAGSGIANQMNRTDLAEWGEQLLELRFFRAERQVAYVNSHC